MACDLGSVKPGDVGELLDDERHRMVRQTAADVAMPVDTAEQRTISYEFKPSLQRTYRAILSGHPKCTTSRLDENVPGTRGHGHFGKCLPPVPG